MELAEDLCLHARVVTSGRVAQLHEAVGTEFDAWGQSGHQRTAEGGHVVGSHPAAERDDLGAEERGVENLFDRADLVWGDVAERSWPQDDAGEAALEPPAPTPKPQAVLPQRVQQVRHRSTRALQVAAGRPLRSLGSWLGVGGLFYEGL